MEKIRNNKGITLIALVVTIIVLLILAGVTISLVIGQNGIITRAKEANIKQENASVLESMKLKVADITIDILGNGAMVEEETELRNQGYMNSSNIVNVEKAVGKKLGTGNGTDNDIYKVENGMLSYYDKQGNKTELGEIYAPVSYPESDPNLFEFEPDTGTIYLKNSESYYNGNILFPDEVMVIPSQIDGVDVKIIGKEAYREAPMGVNARNVKRIIIPDTVVEIGPGAFSRCESLINIQLPKGVTKIGSYAFFYCTSLKNIQIPDKVTIIEDSAFDYCTSLESMKIPNSVTTLEGAFSGCESLISVELPNTITKIGNWAFSECKNLRSITIPNTVTSIENGAFRNAGLTNCMIPNSVISIGSNAFGNCEFLENITIEAGSSLVVPADKWGAPAETTITKL